jgi:hypothetical protein
LYFLSTASSTELDIHDAAEAAQMVSEYVLSRRSDVISGYIYSPLMIVCFAGSL